TCPTPQQRRHSITRAGSLGCPSSIYGSRKFSGSICTKPVELHLPHFTPRLQPQSGHIFLSLGTLNGKASCVRSLSFSRYSLRFRACSRIYASQSKGLELKPDCAGPLRLTLPLFYGKANG